MRWCVLLAIVFAGIPGISMADISTHLNIRTTDGTVSNYPYQLKVTTGTLTDNGDGTMTLQTGGGGGSSAVIASSAVAFGNPVNTISGDGNNLVWGPSAFTLTIGTNPYTNNLFTGFGAGMNIFSQSSGNIEPIVVGNPFGGEYFPFVSTIAGNLQSLGGLSSEIFTMDQNTSGDMTFRTAKGATSGRFLLNGTGTNNMATFDLNGSTMSTKVTMVADTTWPTTAVGPVLTDSAGCTWRTGVTTGGTLTTTLISCPTTVVSRPCSSGQSLGLLLSVTCP